MEEIMSDSHNNVCSLGPTAVAYVSNDLPGEEMLEFEMHLAGCPECFESVSELRRVRSMFQEFVLLRRLARAAVAPASSPVVASQPENDWLGIAAALAFCAQRASAAGDRLSEPLQKWEALLNQAGTEGIEKASALIRDSAKNVRFTWDSMRKVGVIIRENFVQSSGVLAFKAASQAVPTRGGEREVDIQTRLHDDKLLVVIYGLPPEIERLAVVLVPKDEPGLAQGSKGKPQAAYAERKNGSAWVARFDGVMPGEHAVALEPLPSNVGE
jgi:hypothetical protein